MSKVKVLLPIYGLALLGCGDRPPNAVDLALRGEHQVRRLLPTVQTTPARADASFFLLVGHASSVGQVTTDAVRFVWQAPNGEYVFTTLSLDKVRVRLGSTTPPTVRFRWAWDVSKGCSPSTLTPCILYAVVTVREADWPTQVQIAEALK